MSETESVIIRHLETAAARVEREFAARERTYLASREVIRAAAGAIGATLRGREGSEAPRGVQEASERLERAWTDLGAAGNGEHSRIWLDAEVEYTEARLFAAAAAGLPIPGHEELGVAPGSYMLGAGDLVGELRRLALVHLANGDPEGARKVLGLMKATYSSIAGMTYPGKFLPLKAKADTARVLVDRTEELILTRAGP